MGSARDRELTLVNDERPGQARTRTSASADDVTPDTAGAAGVLRKVTEAVRSSKQYEKVVIPPLPNVGQLDAWLSSVGDAM
eukprot:10030256-Lingulodinium_polyedra.AAC.1